MKEFGEIKQRIFITGKKPLWGIKNPGFIFYTDLERTNEEQIQKLNKRIYARGKKENVHHFLC